MNALGPWRRGNIERGAICTQDGAILFRPHPYPLTDQQLDLIAVAPEMLDGIRDCFVSLEAAKLWPEMQRKLYALIQKAEGRA